MTDTIYKGWEHPSVKSDPPSSRFLKMIMSPEVTGYEHATVLFAHIPPGGTTGLHTHTSDEIIHVTGRGVGRVGDKTVNMETDMVILAPRGVLHECRNTGDTDTLKLYCVFIPPLEPTTVLKELIEKTKNHLQKK